MSHELPTEMEALVRAARAARVETDFLLECLRRQIIALENDVWDERAIQAACRARRLAGLGVNMQGLEIIFHMRRQMIMLRQEMAAMEAEMQRARQAHEREVARLLREITRDM